jgi:hypothetical protein
MTLWMVTTPPGQTQGSRRGTPQRMCRWCQDLMPGVPTHSQWRLRAQLSNEGFSRLKSPLKNVTGHLRYGTGHPGSCYRPQPHCWLLQGPASPKQGTWPEDGSTVEVQSWFPRACVGLRTQLYTHHFCFMATECVSTKFGLLHQDPNMAGCRDKDHSSSI